MTETKTTAFERRLYYSQFLREGRTPWHTGPQGKHQDWVRGGRSKGKAWAFPAIVVGSG